MLTVHHQEGHLGWDRTTPPRAWAAPGDAVELVLADCFAGQLGPEATAADVAALDLTAANPLSGPIAVEGVAPGDVVAVEIVELQVATTGWTAMIPGFGLLSDDFPDPHVIVSTIGADRVEFGDLALLPRRPFLGTIGLAPAGSGTHSVIPPRRVGGNLDWRDVGPGATLLLPAEVPDALLSAGDPHATQGDGEVCGTAVETSAVARVRIEVERGRQLPAPQLRLPAETAPTSRGPRWATTGVGPDLLDGARTATRAMIELMGSEVGLEPADAYALCSVAGHLRIAEVVDAPNWVVVMEFDRSVLDG